MEHLNDKIKNLKKDLVSLLKMEKEIISSPDVKVKAATPTDAIKKEIEVLSSQRKKAKEFNDKVEQINDGIIELRTMFESAEQQFLEMVSSEDFTSKDETDRVSKDLDKLRETRSRVYDLKIFKPKNSVLDVDNFSRRINELVVSVEQNTTDVQSKWMKEKEQSLSKEHALKQKLTMLLEERDFELTSLRQEVQKEMELLEARMKAEVKIVLVKLEEIKHIVDTKASDKTVSTRLTEIEREVDNLLRKTESRPITREEKGGISKVVDFLAGEK